MMGNLRGYLKTRSCWACRNVILDWDFDNRLRQAQSDIRKKVLEKPLELKIRKMTLESEKYFFWMFKSCRFTTSDSEVKKSSVLRSKFWMHAWTLNCKLLVPRTGFEPAHLAALPPQSSVSTSPACRQAGSPLGLEKLKSSEFWDQSFGCMRELWTSNYWCPELDSNQHTLRHYPSK